MEVEKGEKGEKDKKFLVKIGPAPVQKPIQSVKVSEMCMETYPCQHFVVITYTDGTTEEKTLMAPTVASYWKFLDENSRRHFSEFW